MLPCELIKAQELVSFEQRKEEVSRHAECVDAPEMQTSPSRVSQKPAFVTL